LNGNQPVSLIKIWIIMWLTFYY